MALESIFARIHPLANGSAISRSTGRGRARRAMRLSAARLSALLGERNLEVTLERTLVALMADGESAGWCNQLNIAAGVGGGVHFNRVAVDLCRLPCATFGTDVVAFAELKAWTSTDTPQAAAAELFRYAAWLSLLRSRGVSPFRDPPWDVDRPVRLYLIAPEAYFRRHGGVASAIAVLRDFETELAALKAVHQVLHAVSFAASPVVLSSDIDPPKFLQAFRRDSIERLIAEGLSTSSALAVLEPQAIPTLQQWFADALSSMS